MEDEDILATAEELRNATQWGLGRAVKEATREEQCNEWLDWLRKRANKLFKDAAIRGQYHVTLELPFQPLSWVDGEEDKEALYRMARKLARQMPGCVISFTEEEWECADAVAAKEYKLEISWAEPAAAPSPAPIAAAQLKELSPPVE